MLRLERSDCSISSVVALQNCNIISLPNVSSSPPFVCSLIVSPHHSSPPLLILKLSVEDLSSHSAEFQPLSEWMTTSHSLYLPNVEDPAHLTHDLPSRGYNVSQPLFNGRQ